MSTEDHQAIDIINSTSPTGHNSPDPKKVSELQIYRDAEHAPTQLSPESNINLRILLIYIIFYGFAFGMMFVGSDHIWIQPGVTAIFVFWWFMLLSERYEVKESESEDGTKKTINFSNPKRLYPWSKNSSISGKQASSSSKNASRKYSINSFYKTPLDEPLLESPKTQACTLKETKYLSRLSIFLFPTYLEAEANEEKKKIQARISEWLKCWLCLFPKTFFTRLRGTKDSRIVSPDAILSVLSKSQNRRRNLKEKFHFFAEAWELAVFNEFRFPSEITREKSNALRFANKDFHWHPMDPVAKNPTFEDEKKVKEQNEREGEENSQETALEIENKKESKKETAKETEYLLDTDLKVIKPKIKSETYLAFRPVQRGPWQFTTLVVSYFFLSLTMCCAHYTLPKECKGQNLFHYCSNSVQGLTQIALVLCAICSFILAFGMVNLPTAGTLSAISHQLELLHLRNPIAAKIREFVVVNSDLREQLKRSHPATIAAFRFKIITVMLLALGGPIAAFSYGEYKSYTDDGSSTRNGSLKDYFFHRAGIPFLACLILATTLSIYTAVNFTTRMSLRGSRRCAFRTRYLTYSLYWIFEGRFLDWKFTEDNKMHLQNLKDLCFSWLEARTMIFRFDNTLEYQQASNFIFTVVLVIIIAVPSTVYQIVTIRKDFINSISNGQTFSALYLWFLAIILCAASTFVILRPFLEIEAWMEEQNILVNTEIGRATGRQRQNYAYRKGEGCDEETEDEKEYIEYLKSFQESLTQNMNYSPKIFGLKISHIEKLIKGYLASGASAAAAVVLVEMRSYLTGK